MQRDTGLSIIVAMTHDRVIGRDNGTPWRVPSDMRRFKQITTGHPVIMGRRSWESIPEKFRPLSNRTNVILTRDTDYHVDDALVVSSVEQALAEAKRSIGSGEIFIIGGEQVYEQFLPMVWRVYLTIVHASVTGDTYFPEMDPSFWRCVTLSTTKKWDVTDEYESCFGLYEPKQL